MSPRLSIWFLSAGLLVGCGPGYETAPVAGRITLDGRPLAGAQITFQPIAQAKDSPNPGSGSYATTDAEGRFRMRLVEPEGDGAVVGTHRVVISTDRQDNLLDDAGSPIDTTVPAKYRDGSQTFIVPPEGTDAADFVMQSGS